MDILQRARLWTAAQYLLLAVIIAGGRVVTASPLGWTLIVAALVLSGWAIWSFRATRLRITPMVAEGGSLIVSGPYRWIRHPMYASVLLAAIGAVALDPTTLRVAGTILIVPTLIEKLLVEEALLHAAYPEYDAYARRTRRLLPFVW